MHLPLWKNTDVCGSFCSLAHDKSIALVSPRIWQVSPLILVLVFLWLLKGITGNSSPKNPSGALSVVGMGPHGSPFLEVDIGAFEKNLYRTSEDNPFFQCPS